MVTLTQAHAALALLSLSGFVLRGVWMMQGSTMLAQRWVKVSPHVVDTFLLLSGLALVLNYHIYPNEQPWLAAKLTALIAYIVVGSIALKRGKTRVIRMTAFVAALAVFGYMLLVATTRSPLPMV